MPFVLLLLLEVFGMWWPLAVTSHLAILGALMYYNYAVVVERGYDQYLPIAQQAITATVAAIGVTLAFNGLGVMFA